MFKFRPKPVDVIVQMIEGHVVIAIDAGEVLFVYIFVK